MKQREWKDGMIRIPRQNCPKCGYKIDAASGVGKSDGVRPKIGDPSPCMKCGELLVFGKGFRLHRPTPAELVDLQRDGVWPELERTIRVIRAVAPGYFEGVSR